MTLHKRGEYDYGESQADIRDEVLRSSPYLHKYNNHLSYKGFHPERRVIRR